MKIDLVYLWCDGDDPAWLAKRESYLPAHKRKDSQTFCKGRIVNNDELRYSLRSVEMYAPWINHIFIITDNQCPAWLDTTHEKITLINQDSILPQEATPIFNSCAIELCIASIEELSEHYIYANDDMMFARAVSPSFFFTDSGKIKARFFRSRLTSAEQVAGETYEYTIMRANEAIAADFDQPEMIGWQPHHNIDVYTKSCVRECLERYREWSSATIHNRFRTPEDMQRHLLSLYAVATGRATPLFVKSHRAFERIFERALLFWGVKEGCDSYCTSLSRPRIESRLKLYRPHLICFNDDQNTTDNDRLTTRELLKKLFPHPSIFEV